MFRIHKIIAFPVFLLILCSCAKHHSLEITPIPYGNIIFTFSHNVNGESLKFDTMLYQTSLGNNYQVTDLQYFISRVSLHSVKGKWHDITTDEGIHYIDSRNNYSCSWWVNDLLPSGSYDSVAFTFGLDEKQNTTDRFPNPPERDMAWPDILGGGYHYMKMNLKWKNDTMSQSLPFMFHLGIGQIYAANTVNPDSIIGFVQNHFRVSLPCKLDLSTGGYHQVMLLMNVDRWFDGQSAFDFSAYPNGIMQNQEGMFRACMNGKKAFSVTITN
jgi:hypothetical protein